MTLLSVTIHAQQKTNIIIINTDDWGYGDLSCLKELADIKTPNIDQLAANGIRFSEGYVTAPQCSPSRAGLLTGRYQQRFGFNEIPDGPLPLTETTIAGRLQAAGYMTGIVGKWHLDPNPLSYAWYREFFPTAKLVDDKRFRDKRYPAAPLHLRLPYLPYARGFTKYFFGEINQYYANYSIDNKKVPLTGSFFQQEGYRIEIQTKAALKFINEHYDQPIFLYLSYFGPHTPLQAPERYLHLFPGKMPERRRYALAMMYAIDKGVGTVMDRIKQLGIADNTLVFFLSDNGAPLGITMQDNNLKDISGWDGSLNKPLLGEKGMLTEGGIRVPFIASWPKKYPKGKVMNIPVSTLDIMPTVLEAAGIGLSGDEDGINLTPYVTQQPGAYPQRYFFWRFWNQSAVRHGKWKYISLSNQHQFLFEIDKDPSEQNNVLARYPDIAKSLKQRLEAWSADLVPAGLPADDIRVSEKQWYDHYLNVR
ncbi:MAG TPA: sulfatase-like hydrolase/transferase [Niabella sp.]|nr:sulfatase-like hydrolase/transferase [Niabella sp.]